MNSPRIASILPYAAWVGYALQLGYFGYTAYQHYQNYIVQTERDNRNGCNRSLNDTIELVIKPKRKRQNQQQQQQQNCDNDTNMASTMAPPSAPEVSDEPSLLQSTNNMNVLNSEQETNSRADPLVQNEEQLQNNPAGPSCAIDNDDVACVYDSRYDQENNEPLILVEGADADEIWSNASTSLESTDTNKGILNDIYSECFICACSLSDPRKPVATLPFCMHPFHQTCLDGVLKWHPKCPVCDFHIFSPI